MKNGSWEYQIREAEKQLARKQEFKENLNIVDCDNCRRRTLPSVSHPRGICMAYNQAPGFVYDKCLKANTFVPKTIIS
jgi:hypothetical protein